MISTILASIGKSLSKILIVSPILDKDFPIEAKIVDIKSFYTLLKTAEGQEITLPNNLLLQKGIEIILEEEYTIKIKPN